MIFVIFFFLSNILSILIKCLKYEKEIFVKNIDIKVYVII